MKKRIVLLMALVLLLTGCGNKMADSQTPADDGKGNTAAESLQKPETSAPAEQDIRFVAETFIMDGIEKTEDEITLATYVFQIPVLKVFREDGTEVTEAQNATEEAALAKAEVFNTTFTEWVEASKIEETIAMAKEHLTFMKESDIDLSMAWVGGYALDLSCSIYQTERMVSVFGIYYTYTGGAHPNTYHVGWNFDLETGTFFDVKMLGEENRLQKAVAEDIIRQAKQAQGVNEWVPIDMYWENHEEIVADWSNYAVRFDESGMAVTFSAYDLAPYAAGPQEFLFSYDWLEPYLSPKGKLLLGL